MNRAVSTYTAGVTALDTGHLDAPVLTLEQARLVALAGSDADAQPSRLRYLWPLPQDLRTPFGYTFSADPDNPLFNFGFTTGGWSYTSDGYAFDRTWTVQSHGTTVNLYDNAEDWMRYGNHPAWGTVNLEVIDPRDPEHACTTDLALHLLAPTLIERAIEHGLRLLAGHGPFYRPASQTHFHDWRPASIKHPELRKAMIRLKNAGCPLHRVISGGLEDEITIGLCCLSDTVLLAAINAGFEVDSTFQTLRSVAPAHLQRDVSDALIHLLNDVADDSIDETGRRYRVPWTLPTVQERMLFTEAYV